MERLCLTSVSHLYTALDGTRTRALENVSLCVEAASATAIIGPSGCGKSTLLQLACGLMTPTKGAVSVDDVALRAPREGTGLILQDFGLLPWKSVLGNAELGLKLRGLARRERRARAREALELVGLAPYADRYPGELSGGMQQRLALARVLALDIDVLLMDEPLSALDALLREQLQETLLSLWRVQGYAQVLVTHSIEEAVFLGQRIVVMSPRPGRVIDIVDNPHMGQPGYRGSEEFFAQTRLVRALLHEGAQRGERVEEAAYA